MAESTGEMVEWKPPDFGIILREATGCYGDHDLYKLTPADHIWNRACSGGGSMPGVGDRALADLLRAHGLTMNGGVFHAAECLSSTELASAASGYRFFGLDPVGELLLHARQLLERDQDLELLESTLDKRYQSFIPDDGFLMQRFKNHLSRNPVDYAPI